ncbi:MAG: hypothetical protein MUO50_10550, partial [Longimicrobiales bacterium]|nr:hypothetical protein [Longimicrobiales bacterium]
MMHSGRIILGIFTVTLLGAGILPGRDLTAQVAAAFPHGTFPEGISCLDCHTNEGWRPIQANPVFDHA